MRNCVFAYVLGALCLACNPSDLRWVTVSSEPSDKVTDVHIDSAKKEIVGGSLRCELPNRAFEIRFRSKSSRVVARLIPHADDLSNVNIKLADSEPFVSVTEGIVVKKVVVEPVEP